ncbi:MAG: glycosyltransferase family 1 protein [Anaerolineae bacterium]|nr:glycosyltransferase family 1 protein [Anaerolineae bacterium]
MAKFWFVSAPLPGHLDWGGYLQTGQALQAAGHDVLWISEPPIQAMVEVAGLPFAEVPQTGWLWPPPPPPDLSGLPPQEAVDLRYRRALDTWLTADLVVPAVEALLALTAAEGAPDAIATDPFLAASALAAEALDVPLAVCGWPAMLAPDERALLPIQMRLGILAQDRIRALAGRFDLDGTNFSGGLTPAVQSPYLHVSYFSRYWHQADPGFLPQTQFVGGQPVPPEGDPPAWLADLPADAPLGLVTLGTVFTGDLGFFAWAAQAMARLGLVPLVVVGRSLLPEEKDQLKGTLPGGTRLLPWVDFAHVFPRLKVIVHHGGMGTTHAAVVHGVPQVIVPHAADQRGQAKRASQAKVALNLTAHDVRNGQLLPAIRAVSTDPKVIETARRLAGTFAALGGPAKAAQLMLDLLR